MRSSRYLNFMATKRILEMWDMLKGIESSLWYLLYGHGYILLHGSFNRSHHLVLTIKCANSMSFARNLP